MAGAGQSRFFKDAVTGDPRGIAFDTADPHEQLLISLIDTPAMARMGRILQLGAKSTLIGAEHTRREHMIHAAALARYATAHLRRAMDRAQPGLYDPRLGLACMVACCLHDIGHPPLGHEFETVAQRVSGRKFHHEDWSARLIREDVHIQSCLQGFVTAHTGYAETFVADYGMTFDEMVVALIEGKAPCELAAYQSLVSGKIDCDRGSFLPIDRAQAQGVNLETELPDDLWADIELAQVDGVTVIVHDRVKAEQFLMVWREQYEKIYYVAGSDSKESMLAPILHDFLQSAHTTLEHLSLEEMALYRVLSNDGTASIRDYLMLDDRVIERVIERAAESNPDPWVRRLAQGIMQDDILPSLDFSHLDKKHRDGLIRYLQTRLPEGVVDGTHIFVTNEKSRDVAKLHKAYGTPAFDDHHNVAYVRNATGNVVPVQHASTVIQGTPPLNAMYLHAEADVLYTLVPVINDYLAAAGYDDSIDAGSILYHTGVRHWGAAGSAPAGVQP
ncbi:MAG: HD domain-containing protein [Alphaproteobacteria bacterium]|nr:HD domain-containing protein [Alphaproteobacteria bacterium]MBV8548133.1 HD domain-containing protein [Alphaproteobacteria bacterium]